MNLDPKLDFGWGTPRMSEVEPLNGHQMLQEAKEHLVHMLDIENEEQWQASCRNTSFPELWPCTSYRLSPVHDHSAAETAS